MSRDLKLHPSERFLLLSQLVEELPADVPAETLRAVTAACFAVVRHMQGTITEGEARFAVNRARDELFKALKAESLEETPRLALAGGPQ